MRDRKSRIISVVGVVTAAVLLMAGCGSARSAHPNAAPRASKPLSPAATALRFTAPPWGVPSNNPYNPDYPANVYTDAVQIPLAIPELAPAKFGAYYPELATGWNTTPSTITLHLRPTARWQNGQPFTGEDVVDSLLLSGATLNSMWQTITSVKTRGPHTVVIDITRGEPASLLLPNILPATIVPASQYGKLIPPGLERDIVHYWQIYDPSHPTAGSEAAAAASPEFKALSAVGKKLTEFAPATLLGDGPFELVRATTSNILLKKWPGFWDAKKISEPWVEAFAIADFEPAYMSGRVDFTEGNDAPGPLWSKISKTPYLHIFNVPTNLAALGLIFNFHDYPLNLTSVRQAIAYVINRTNVDRAIAGGPVVRVPTTAIPDDLPNDLTAEDLTKSDSRHLNTYSYNPSRATALLESAGFTKQSGIWYTPRHLPFKLTVTTNGGVPAFVTASVEIGRQLTAFGIHAEAQPLTGPALQAGLTNGSLEMSFWFTSFAESLDPLYYFQSTLGSFNYPATWDGQGSCHCQTAIGMGPFASVPGLGKVNLGQTIARETTTVSPGTAEMRRLTFDWARLFNAQLPVLGIIQNAEGENYSSRRYTRWPPEKSVAWTFASGAASRILPFNQMGYIRLRRSGT